MKYEEKKKGQLRSWTGKREVEEEERNKPTSRTVTITSIGQSTLVQMTFERDSKRFVEASFSLCAASCESEVGQRVSEKKEGNEARRDEPES